MDFGSGRADYGWTYTQSVSPQKTRSNGEHIDVNHPHDADSPSVPSWRDRPLWGSVEWPTQLHRRLGSPDQR